MSDYMGLICSIVREKLHTICDDFEMESCVSDVFIEFYQKIDRYSDDRGTIKALLCVIAKRKAIDVFRKKSKEFGNVCMDDEVYANTVKDKINLENEYILKEQKGQLIEAIKTLGGSFSSRPL